MVGVISHKSHSSLVNSFCAMSGTVSNLSGDGSRVTMPYTPPRPLDPLDKGTHGPIMHGAWPVRHLGLAKHGFAKMCFLAKVYFR